MTGEPAADDYFDYIERHAPEIGDFRESTFFQRLLGTFEPGQEWPLMPTESPAVYRNMGDNWMFWAGVSIARNERRVDEFLAAVREIADPEAQADMLLQVINEEKRPDLLDEASAKWEEHVFKARQDVISDQDLNPTYEYLCILAARYKRPDIFEANLSRLPSDWQAGVLADAAMERGNLEYLERAVKQLESIEEKPDYHTPTYVAERAAKLGNYDAAVRALTIAEGIEYEGEGIVSDVIRIAVRDDKIEELRRATVNQAAGFNLHHLSIELTKAGDVESALIAAQSLRSLPLDKYVLYNNAYRVAKATKGLEASEVRDQALGMVTDFINEAFYEAYKDGDTSLAFNAALASLKAEHSLELMKIILFDKKDAAEDVADELIQEGEWGGLGSKCFDHMFA